MYMYDVRVYTQASTASLPLGMLAVSWRLEGIADESDPSRKLALVTVVHELAACTCGRVLCLECRVSWVRVPPKAAHFS